MDKYDYRLLMGIKERLGITGNFHDRMLLDYAEDVRYYMFSAGVDPRVVHGEAAIGCIARGVADLWNQGAGEGRFSDMFLQRVTQLALPASGYEDGCGAFDPTPRPEIDAMFGFHGHHEPCPGIPGRPDYHIATDEMIDHIFDCDGSCEPCHKPCPPPEAERPPMDWHKPLPPPQPRVRYLDSDDIDSLFDDDELSNPDGSGTGETL